MVIPLRSTWYSIVLKSVLHYNQIHVATRPFPPTCLGAMLRVRFRSQPYSLTPRPRCLALLLYSGENDE